MARTIGALVAGTLVAACMESEPPPGPSWSVTTHPQAADEYARLLREYLLAPDPPAMKQRLTCEYARIARALGTNETERRMFVVHDMVVPTKAAEAAFERADIASSGHYYEVRGPICDSLQAITNRDLGPIRPAPASLRER